jgi:hypothetical protein
MGIPFLSPLYPVKGLLCTVAVEGIIHQRKAHWLISLIAFDRLKNEVSYGKQIIAIEPSFMLSMEDRLDASGCPGHWLHDGA